MLPLPTSTSSGQSCAKSFEHIQKRGLKSCLFASQVLNFSTVWKTAKFCKRILSFERFPKQTGSELKEECLPEVLHTGVGIHWCYVCKNIRLEKAKFAHRCPPPTNYIICRRISSCLPVKEYLELQLSNARNCAKLLCRSYLQLRSSLNGLWSSQ